MRVWFNRTFSSLHGALRLVRDANATVAADRRVTVYVTAAHAHALVGTLADHFEVEPAGLKGDDYLAWCVDFCAAHAIDVFVPGRDAVLMAANHDRFAAVNTRVLSAADAPTLELLHDKQRFYETVQCAAAPAPDTIAVSTLAEFDRAFDVLGGRHTSVCMKPSVGVYGIGFRRIRTDLDAMDVLLKGLDYQIDLKSLRFALGQVETFPVMLVMEYMPGEEFSVDCIADQGVLHCAIARRKVPAAGHGQLIDDREDIQQACRDIVAQFRLNGFLNIQFRQGEHGLRILEVNPRMSGGIAMACQAGPNLPMLGLQGFAHGYTGLGIGPVAHGLRVGEYNLSTVLP